MSWLLVAVVPILLMLATVALERIETRLDLGTPVVARPPERLPAAPVTPGPAAASVSALADPQFHRTKQPHRV